MQVLVFEALGDPFAVRVETIRSVVRKAPRRALPSAVPWVAGVAEVRGKILPLVDLGLRLGRGATGLDGDLVVVEVGEEAVVVPVERVVGLETLEGVAPPPPGAGEAAAGIALVGDRLVLVLDARALLPGGGAAAGPVTAPEPVPAAAGITELVLDDDWDGDPSVFADHPRVEALRLSSRTVDDISAIHELEGLRELEVQTRCRTPIDLRAFPRLERLSLRWRAGSTLESDALLQLELQHYTAKDLRGLAGLPALRSLAVEFGPLERLDGVEALEELEELRLRNLRRLEQLDGAGHVARVETYRCPRLSPGA